MTDTPATPYREPPREPRYICIVCFSWASIGPGTCGKCRAPLHDIGKPDVLQVMHDEANRRLRRGRKREYAAAMIPWTIVWLGLEPWIGRTLAFFSGAVIGIAWLYLYPRLRPGKSAVATLDARVLRKQTLTKPEDAVPILTKVPPKNPEGTPDRDMARFAGPDPDLLDAAGLVKWFGATLHG